MEDFHVPLSDSKRDLFVQAFVANFDRSNAVINIGRLFNIRAVTQIRKLYDRVDLYEEPDNPDLVDLSGYLGLFYREKKQLAPISEAELVEIIARRNRFPQIMKIIKEIDRDNNGYVTNQELDDIFKINYEEELASRDLKPVFKRFASLQNRVLIDYKRVRDHFAAKVTEARGKPLLLSEDVLSKLSTKHGSVVGSRMSMTQLPVIEKP